MSEFESIRLKIEKALQQNGDNVSSDLLAEYLMLLHKWNSAYNLTAVRDVDSMICKHLLDSLAIIPWLKGKLIIDVGTGAGLPGIPLAVAKPETNFVLLDANGKKIRFLKEACRHLDLKNVEIVQFRVENYHSAQGFDTVVSRAFSNLAQMIQCTQHLIAKKGIWLAMKGRYPDAELNNIKKPYKVAHYSVSGIEGERCCVVIEN